MQEAIKKAQEGGYKPGPLSMTWSPFLEPSFWQALGMAEGWGNSCLHIVEGGEYKVYRHQAKCSIGFTEWEMNWHNFIDHLAEGKDADSFFNELLK